MITGALQSLLLIPRTPSPTLEESALEKLNTKEPSSIKTVPKVSRSSAFPSLLLTPILTTQTQNEIEQAETDTGGRTKRERSHSLSEDEDNDSAISYAMPKKAPKIVEVVELSDDE